MPDPAASAYPAGVTLERSEVWHVFSTSNLSGESQQSTTADHALSSLMPEQGPLHPMPLSKPRGECSLESWRVHSLIFHRNDSATGVLPSLPIR
jgi:hypothetical protein